MIEAAGSKWKSRDIRLARDARLKATVARIRGIALVEGTEHSYEVRLWICPKTKLLYIAALSAMDKFTLDRFSDVFDRIGKNEQ